MGGVNLNANWIFEHIKDYIYVYTEIYKCNIVIYNVIYIYNCYIYFIYIDLLIIIQIYLFIFIFYKVGI